MLSFFRSLKAERAYLTRFASYQETNADLFDDNASTITAVVIRRGLSQSDKA